MRNFLTMLAAVTVAILVASVIISGYGLIVSSLPSTRIEGVVLGVPVGGGAQPTAAPVARTTQTSMLPVSPQVSTESSAVLPCMADLATMSRVVGVSLVRIPEAGGYRFALNGGNVTIPAGWIGTVDSVQGLVVIEGPAQHNAYRGTLRCKAAYPEDDAVHNVCQLLSKEEAYAGRNGYAVKDGVRLNC